MSIDYHDNWSIKWSLRQNAHHCQNTDDLKSWKHDTIFVSRANMIPESAGQTGIAVKHWQLPQDRPKNSTWSVCQNQSGAHLIQYGLCHPEINGIDQSSFLSTICSPFITLPLLCVFYTQMSTDILLYFMLTCHNSPISI